MAIRKSADEVIVVEGLREQWLEKCEAALRQGGFSKISSDRELWQIHANYKKMTVWGTLDITLRPHGDGSTELHARATANVDNVFALFRSPTKHILESFKSGLTEGALIS